MYIDDIPHIKYIPVCSMCGEPISKYEQIYVSRETKQGESGYKYLETHVHPCKCEKCGAMFEYISKLRDRPEHYFMESCPQ